jgi:glycosyltransferase involved in cell wall biosynthesis
MMVSDMARTSTRGAAALNLFTSTAIEGEIAQLLGAPHYSYHFAAERFTAMLARRGHAPCHLLMPEYYATAAALPPRGPGADVHLIFRSTEQLRLLKPAVNICCFAWEFPVLKEDTLPGEHPFANQHAMLSLCDEIWTPSEAACAVLRAHGLNRVQRIAAPVPLPEGDGPDRGVARAALAGIDAVTLDINFAWPESYQNERAAARKISLGDFLTSHQVDEAAPTVFLAILNPEDFRKNLDALLRGFHQLRRLRPDTVLIVKALTSANRYGLGEVAGGVMRNKLAPGTVLCDGGIAIINAWLDEAQMSCLYRLADFYLCTSLAEGQNLPLLEAMAHGTVAVTTANTAMADYITEQNAFIIASRRTINDCEHLAGTIARRAFCVDLCGAADVVAAAGAALAASAAVRAERAAAGIATLRRDFGEDAIYKRVQARLRHHAQLRRAA